MQVKVKSLPYAALIVSFGVLSTQCRKAESQDSDLSIRNGKAVAANSTGPDRVSTVGISTGCTGSIIAENLILTAAHCISNGNMSVVFRTNMYAQGTGAVIPVEKKVINAQYKPTGPYIVPYDIALLKLQTKIPANYMPVKLLPADQQLKPGEAVLQAGYGETLQRGGGTFGTLRSVANTYQGRGSVGRVIVNGKNFTGTCAGDSGGPLFVKRGDSWYVAGALSGGPESAQFGCGGGGTYTGVAEFQDWIIRAAKSLNGDANPFPAAPAAPKPVAPVVKELSFGPFGANESKLLTTLESKDGKFVNFTIQIDVEFEAQCNFDSVIIQDAAGFARKICGKGSYKATNLVAPVKISFLSDEATVSQLVKISAVSFFDAMAQGEQSSAGDVSTEIPVDANDVQDAP